MILCHYCDREVSNPDPLEQAIQAHTSCYLDIERIHPEDESEIK